MKWTTKLHWGYLPLLVPLLGRRLTHIIKKKRERIHTKQLTEPSVEFSLSLTFFLLTSPFFFPRHLLAAVHRGDLNWIFLGFHHFLLGCKEFRGTADPISNVGHVAPEEMPNSVFSSAWKVKVELPSQWYRLRRTPIGPGLLRPSRHRITRRNRNSGTDCVTENSPVTWSMKTWKKSDKSPNESDVPRTFVKLSNIINDFVVQHTQIEGLRRKLVNRVRHVFVVGNGWSWQLIGRKLFVSFKRPEIENLQWMRTIYSFYTRNIFFFKKSIHGKESGQMSQFNLKCPSFLKKSQSRRDVSNGRFDESFLRFFVTNELWWNFSDSMVIGVNSSQLNEIRPLNFFEKSHFKKSRQRDGKWRVGR